MNVCLKLATAGAMLNGQYWVVTAATGTNQTAPLTEAIVQARKHPALFTSVADIRH